MEQIVDSEGLHASKFGHAPEGQGHILQRASGSNVQRVAHHGLGRRLFGWLGMEAKAGVRF
jgi:hypothetical protein